MKVITTSLFLPILTYGTFLDKMPNHLRKALWDLSSNLLVTLIFYRALAWLIDHILKVSLRKRLVSTTHQEVECTKPCDIENPPIGITSTSIFVSDHGARMNGGGDNSDLAVEDLTAGGIRKKNFMPFIPAKLFFRTFFGALFWTKCPTTSGKPCGT